MPLGASIEEQPKLGCRAALCQLGIQPCSPVAWSPDGRMLAFVSGSNGICIARKSDEALAIQHVLTAHDFAVNCLVFHPTEPTLLSAGVEGIFVWDLQTMTLRFAIILQ